MQKKGFRSTQAVGLFFGLALATGCQPVRRSDRDIAKPDASVGDVRSLLAKLKADAGEISEAEARVIAELEFQGAGESPSETVIEPEFEEKPFGWVFFWAPNFPSRQCILIYGGSWGAIVVERDGHVGMVLDSPHPSKGLEEYERAWTARKADAR